MANFNVIGFSIAGFAALLAACALASSAQAHARLIGAEPKAASHLKTSPGDVRATFSEPLIVAFSAIALNNAAGEPVQVGKVFLAPYDQHTLVAPVLSRCRQEITSCIGAPSALTLTKPPGSTPFTLNLDN